MDESAVVERLSSAEFVNVVGHADADGVSSSACVCMALSILDVPYRFTAVEEPGDAPEEVVGGDDTNDVLCDLGAQYLSSLPEDTVVIDHHTPRGEGPPVLGTGELSSSLPAYRVAREVGVRGVAAPFSALVGVVGDGGSLGDEEVVDVADDATEAGAQEKEGALVPGEEPVESLAYATRPFTRLSGDYEGARDFVENHGIEGFGSDFSTALVLLALTNPSARPDAVERLVGDELDFEGARLHSLSRYVEACAKTGKHGLALTLCVEPRSDRREEARTAWHEFESDVIRRVREARIEEGEPDVARVEGETSPVADVLYDWMTGDVVVVNAEGEASLRSSSFDCGRVAGEAAEATDGEGGGHENRGGATFDAPAEVFVREVRRAL